MSTNIKILADYNKDGSLDTVWAGKADVLNSQNLGLGLTNKVEKVMGRDVTKLSLKLGEGMYINEAGEICSDGSGSGGGEGGDTHLDSGEGTFAGEEVPVIIQHNLNIEGDYRVYVTPSGPTFGTVGEFWFEVIDGNSFAVMNTGSNKTTKFDWIVVKSK